MSFRFNADQAFFDRIFPFTFIFDKDLKIIQAGRSISKLLPGILEASFKDYFTVSRPRSAAMDFESFCLYTDQIFIVEGDLEGTKVVLRGEMCLLEDDRMAYFCSPWLTTPDDLEKFNLSLGDYALHDSVTDLLHLIKVKDITNEDSKTLNQMLKGSELRLSNLIRNLQSGILLEDENRRIILSNQFLADIFAIPVSPEAMVGMDCSQSAEQSKHLFLDPEGFVKRVDELVERRELCSAEEIMMKDGRCLERDFIPIYHDGIYMGHLWQYRDLTDQKRWSAELLKAKKEADAAREAEKEFIAHMSHEIRTPLNSIIGMSHLLESTDLSAQQKEYLEIQRSSTEILYSLINDILDISKIESGNIETNLEKVDLSDELQKQYQTFYHQLLDSPVELKLDVDSSLDEYMMGDKVFLNQVLFNLIGNAVKFTEKGSIELKGKVVESTGPIKMVCISVKDTGIGIPRDKQEDIFEKFKQVDNQMAVRFGGTGLGLAITRRIVDLLGGTITVESKVGKGSTFRVFLPMYCTGEKIESSTETGGQQKAIKSFEGMRFLIAEDNEMNIYYIQKILEKTKVEADYAKNGLEACQLASATDYDLILMDLRMPEMDGMQATVKIRSEQGPNQRKPIMALTASVFKNAEKKAEKFGFDGFLSKPFTPDQLFEKISELLFENVTPGEGTTVEKVNGIDTTFIEDFYEGDLEEASEFMDMFISNNYPLFNEVGEQLEAGAFESARETVHKIKPSFAMIGLTDLQAEMQRLEDMCGQQSPDALSLFHAISVELENSIPRLNTLYSPNN